MRKEIQASEGMILTNGVIYGKVIYVAEDVDINSFYEITEEEYDNINEESTEVNN